MNVKNLGVVLVFAMVPFLSFSQTPSPSVPLPTGFDAKTPAPSDVPLKMNIPLLTQVTVQVHRKIPLPAAILADRDRLWSDPDLQTAVFENDGKTVHAVYQWEGGRSSEGYSLQGTAFHLGTLKYPELIQDTPSSLGYFLSSYYRITHPEQSGGNFPGLDWYAPERYAGTANLQGESVLVFTSRPLEPTEIASFPPKLGYTLYVDQTTLRPALFDAFVFAYTFSYTPAPTLRIHASGPYLKAIQQKFGTEKE
jgi:hypothetical protein